MRMKEENSRMILLAWIGVLFIPTSLVSSIFDAVHDQANTTQETLVNFGYLMAVAAPLTLLTVFASGMWGKGMWQRRGRIPEVEELEMGAVRVAP
jgi:hypothetical protein